MAERSTRRVGGQGASPPVVRTFEGRTRKVTLALRPADADKLRLVCVSLGVDLGDVVTTSLAPWLSGWDVVVRPKDRGAAVGVSGPGGELDPPTDAGGGPRLGVAG